MTSTESDMKKIPWIDSSDRLPKKGEIALIAYDNLFTKSEEYDVVTMEDNSVNYPLWATHPLWISIIGSETYASYEIKRWILLKYTRDMQLEDRPYAEQPSEDCISRQAVIRLVEQYPNIIGNRCNGLIADIKHLPPVTPQPKIGHWRHYEGMLMCSECKAEFYDDIMEYCGDDVPKCCPSCGAKMEVEE